MRNKIFKCKAVLHGDNVMNKKSDKFKEELGFEQIRKVKSSHTQNKKIATAFKDIEKSKKRYFSSIEELFDLDS